MTKPSVHQHCTISKGPSTDRPAQAQKKILRNVETLSEAYLPGQSGRIVIELRIYISWGHSQSTHLIIDHMPAVRHNLVKLPGKCMVAHSG